MDKVDYVIQLHTDVPQIWTAQRQTNFGIYSWIAEGVVPLSVEYHVPTQFVTEVNGGYLYSSENIARPRQVLFIPMRDKDQTIF